jgi:hypothetical protein
VATTPFHDIPKVTFLNRTIWPSLGALVFLYLCVGVVANSSEFQQPRGPTAVIPFWEAALKHYQDFFSLFSSVPGVCWFGSAVNDFQVSQCNQLWGQLFRQGSLAGAPFIVIGIALLICLDSLAALYKRTQKKIQIGKADFTGTVTNPPEAPNDFFSWFYCLRPIMVQLKDRTQVKVYVPWNVTPPQPGETLIAFNLGSVLGEKRHLGMAYTPHVAIVRGE